MEKLRKLKSNETDYFSGILLKKLSEVSEKFVLMASFIHWVKIVVKNENFTAKSEAKLFENNKNLAWGEIIVVKISHLRKIFGAMNMTTLQEDRWSLDFLKFWRLAIFFLKLNMDSQQTKNKN